MTHPVLAGQELVRGYKPATKTLEEPCWNKTEEVNQQLQSLRSFPKEDKPSEETIDWAYEILFSKVLPRMLLLGAEVNAFAGEVHVSWENEHRRIVAFFPMPKILKVYSEQIENGRAVNPILIPNASATDLCEALRLFR